MNLNVSYSCSDSINEKIEYTEEFFEVVIEDIFRYILNTDYVKNNLKIYNSLISNYEVVELSLYLCDNEEIKYLNSKYRGIDSPTDVLSFPMSAEENLIDLPILHLGEIIISIEKLREQAKQNSHDEMHEMLYLISHGMLHLLGAHHETVENYNNVVDLQNRVVEYITNR